MKAMQMAHRRPFRDIGHGPHRRQSGQGTQCRHLHSAPVYRGRRRPSPASIAAASVLAKVSRDHYVTEVLDKTYPQYQFAKHKGYGTKLHYEMLDKYGPCPEHRRSFLKKWEAKR